MRPLTDRPSVVSITVMWELSWYRFEVDLSDEAGGVRRDAQGDELAELAAPRSRRPTPRPTSAARCICMALDTMTDARSRPPRFVSIRSVIYCVVPEPLADELYEKLATYYEDDPNVEVIVDRRKRSAATPAAGGGQREVRDRRRPRVAGEFPPLVRRRSA